METKRSKTSMRSAARSPGLSEIGTQSAGSEVRRVNPREIDRFCRERSLEQQEPMPGTALECVEHWLMVEDSSSWGAKPLKKNGFDSAVRNRLQEISDQPGWRVNLIRRPSGTREASSAKGTRLFIGRLIAGDRRFLSLELDSPQELLQLDFGFLVRNAPEITIGSSPIFFVCTHGQRDACCAKWGVPLFHAMSHKLPGQVWQCSHLGGHRFAPNVLVMPYGLMYGRVELEQVPELIAETVNGRIFDLRQLRGRVSSLQIAQAAEVFLRSAMSDREIDAIQYDSHVLLGDNHWRVQFSRDGSDQSTDTRRNRIYSIDLERRKAERTRLVSCGDDIESNYSYFLRS